MRGAIHIAGFIPDKINSDGNTANELAVKIINLEFTARKNSANPDFFFAHPYSSWERELNKHQNSLIRDFFPKKTDFRLIDDFEIKKVENN